MEPQAASQSFAKVKKAESSDIDNDIKESLQEDHEEIQLEVQSIPLTYIVGLTWCVVQGVTRGLGNIS